MKKTYRKPDFQIESFALAQSVAAGCGVTPGGSTLGTPNHWGKGDCGWDMGSDLVIWAASTADGKCSYIVDDNEEIFGMCYNNPEGFNTVFGSY